MRMHSHIKPAHPSMFNLAPVHARRHDVHACPTAPGVPHLMHLAHHRYQVPCSMRALHTCLCSCSHLRINPPYPLLIVAKLSSTRPISCSWHRRHQVPYMCTHLLPAPDTMRCGQVGSPWSHATSLTQAATFHNAYKAGNKLLPRGSARPVPSGAIKPHCPAASLVPPLASASVSPASTSFQRTFASYSQLPSRGREPDQSALPTLTSLTT